MPSDVCPIKIAMIILSEKISRKYKISRVTQAKVMDKHITQAFFKLKISFSIKSKKNSSVMPSKVHVKASIILKSALFLL